MMCIKQREEQLTTGFCQANKNRNVIPVSEAADQSSPPLSPTGCLSLSPSWRRPALTIWKGEEFLPLFKYPRVWFQCEAPAPLPGVSGGPASGDENALKHLCWIISTSRNFPTFFPVSFYAWCNSVQIHLDESLINWNKISGCIIVRVLWHCVKVNFTGQQKIRHEAMDSSCRLFFVSINSPLILFRCLAAATHADRTDGASRLRHGALCVIMHQCD